MSRPPSTQFGLLALLTAATLVIGCYRNLDNSAPPPAQSPIVIDPGDWTCPPNTSGSPMVLIPMPDGAPYCIDSRQATYGDYALFLEAKGNDFSDQPSECAWNDDYGPVEMFDAGFAHAFRCSPPLDEADPDRPVGCVDFCDAWAFCSWAGKRLCGVRGAEPGKVMVVEVDPQRARASPSWKLDQSLENEWYYVCTQRGSSKYPFDDTPDRQTCDSTRRLSDHRGPSCAIPEAPTHECRGTHPPFDSVFGLTSTWPTWLNICYLPVSTPVDQVGSIGQDTLIGRAGPSLMQVAERETNDFYPIRPYCIIQGGMTSHDDFPCRSAYRRPSSSPDDSGVRCCASAIPLTDGSNAAPSTSKE